MKLFLVLSLISISLPIFGNNFKNCSSYKHNQILNFEKTQIQVVHYQGGKCLFSVRNNDSFDLIFRSYLFNNRGDLVVFNSFGTGAPSTDTGARSYTFLPLHQELALKTANDDQDLLIRTPSGRIITFDTSKARVIDISEAHFYESDEVRGDNKGGLEITPLSGLILDEGWRQGGLPRVKKEKFSIFKDGKGETCSIKNSQLFRYIFDQNGYIDEVNSIYLKEKEVRHFLQKNCPQITF